MGLEKVIKICAQWEIEALTSLSLLLQVILIVFGSRRKITPSKWINFLVWSAYLSADWVATVALCILARSFSDANPNPNLSLQAFWAPFLVLHLGGPDTITAFSLEDNELWERHLLGLIFQVGVSIFVCFRSWTESGSTLCFIAIPVYIAGIIKYGERTWVLWSSSTKRFSINLSKKPRYRVQQQSESIATTDAKTFFYILVSWLYAGSLIKRITGVRSRANISRKNAQDAFKLVEAELGHLYDALYTKATIVHSVVGRFLRFITFLASVSALVTFRAVHITQSYSSVDICVTYLLLVGAIVLEVYAMVFAALSDWRERSDGFLRKNIIKRKRWSRAIAQYNLMDDCIIMHHGTQWKRILGIVGIQDRHHVTWKPVNYILQDSIFEHIKKRREDFEQEKARTADRGNRQSDYISNNTELLSNQLNYRGNKVLVSKGYLNEFRWSTIDADFNHSLLIWYIATELCYYDDIDIDNNNNPRIDQLSEISRSLSNYMLYLLFMCPRMLPKGFGLDKRARSEVMDLLKSDDFSNKQHMCQRFYNSGVTRYSYSLFMHGIQLAKQLQKQQNLNNSTNNPSPRTLFNKWDVMNQVWLELLTYAATHCEWKEHGHQLTKGGELLTHVCVLMAHFGLSEQYQVAELSVIFENLDQINL